MEYVTLSNGKKVDWDEFSTWSAIKQNFCINPPNKGRKFNEEFKEKIRQARKNEMLNGTRKIIKGGEHPHSRIVSTPNGVFETIKEAGIFYKVRGSTIMNWIKNGKEGFAFSSPPPVRSAPIKKGGLSGSSNGSARAVITPHGRFGTVKEAISFLGITAEMFYSKIMNSSNGEFRYESESKGFKVGINPNSQRIMTPSGEFDTIASAAKHFGITAQSMRYRAKSIHQPEFYILDAPGI
jgi:hypothetical protein